MNVNFQQLFLVVKMTERRKNQSEEWTYFTQLFIYFITVNKYRFCISVIGYINMQIIGIGFGYKKNTNIGRSLAKIPLYVVLHFLKQFQTKKHFPQRSEWLQMWYWFYSSANVYIVQIAQKVP